jgi:hypothetical protein
MEVHSHSHTRRKKWTHYFWEFIMLFLAVFCGFLAENYREHRVEHNRTAHYAKQFINEIELDTALLNTGVDFVARKKRNFDSLLYAIDQKNWKQIYLWATDIDGYYLAKFHSATFEQIKYSGYLRNFKSEKLVTTIQDYINLRDNIEIMQHALADYYDKMLTPWLNNNLNRRYMLVNNYRETAVYDSLWTANPLPSSLITDTDNGLVTFTNILATLHDSFVLDQLYRMLIEKSAALISQLKKEFHIK